ncbi:hypothetical protein [Agromyces cerinus]|nr:hypothetical protein [Agromyces cerinus]
MKNDKDADLDARVRAEEDEFRDVMRAGAPDSGTGDDTAVDRNRQVEQDGTVMDGDNASDQSKWEGIIAQTRADLEGQRAEQIRSALSQRVRDAKLDVSSEEIDRASTEIAMAPNRGDLLSRNSEGGRE